MVCKPYIPFAAPFDSYIIQKNASVSTFTGSIAMGGSLFPTAASSALTANNWYFMALTWTSGQTAKLTIWNHLGVQVSQTATASAVSGSLPYDVGEPLWIGQNESADNLDANICYVGVHNADLLGTSTLDNWRMKGDPGITLSGCFVKANSSTALVDSAQGQTVTNSGAVYSATLDAPPDGVRVGTSSPGGVFPIRHAGLGPFISSAGNVYFITKSSGSVGNASAQKSPSDPLTGGAWSVPATSKLMSSGAAVAIEAMCCVQNGNVIYVFTQIATGAVYFNSYTMDTDTWGLTTSTNPIAAVSFAPTAGYTFVSAVYRPTANEFVLIYCAGLTAMASGFNMVKWVRINTSGVASSVPANVDNGGSVNWTDGVAVLGASDRVHFALLSFTNTSAYQRTLTAANALQTFPSAFATGVGGGAVLFPIGPPVSYLDSGTTRVRIPYRTTAGLLAFASFDSVDAPTPTVATAGDNVTKLTNTQSAHVAVMDGTTIHALYSDTTANDLYHDVSAGGGGAFGTDVNELIGTINVLSANVYTRSGAKYLAMVLDDNGTIRYGEILLSAAPALTPIKLVGMVGIRGAA